MRATLGYLNLIFGHSPRADRFWQAFVTSGVRHKFGSLQPDVAVEHVMHLGGSTSAVIATSPTTRGHTRLLTLAWYSM